MPERDLALPSGRLRALERGRADGPLVLCVHGLSGNLTAFAAMGPRLAARGCRVVALDLRGRGRSDVTAPGSYGLQAHAADLLDAADVLGAERFAVAGWSLGALIGIVAAARAPGRVSALALIDHAGGMDPGPLEATRAGLARLDAVAGSPEDYLARVREASPVERWSAFWDDYHRYELARREDGAWSPTTDAAACAEDLDDAVTYDWPQLWPQLRCPVALVRCARPFGGGFVVPAAVRDAFAAAVPDAAVTEVDANHFDVIDDEAAVAAVEQLVARAA